MSKSSIVLFVCEHGSAKSTIAAAHFNNLARERNLNARAISRGTDPDDAYPSNVIDGLLSDGLYAEESSPRKLTEEDVASACCVVSFRKLPPEQSGDLRDWSDVPPVSVDYALARNDIVGRVKAVIDELHPETKRS